MPETYLHATDLLSRCCWSVLILSANLGSLVSLWLFRLIFELYDPYPVMFLDVTWLSQFIVSACLAIENFLFPTSIENTSASSCLSILSSRRLLVLYYYHHHHHWIVWVYICHLIYVCDCKYHSMHVTLKRQLCRVGFLFPLWHGFWV